MNLRQLTLTLFLTLGLLSLSISVGAQQIQIKGPKTGNTEFSGTTYGPVTPADTLWRIANRYRQNKNLSVYQVMQGIYELNPDSFEDNNFNHLKDGSILNLPSERYIARIDPEQARLKAEGDDSNWSDIAKADGNASTAVKANSSGVASKDDLSETKQVIEDKLTELDAEQNRQFMAIRQQFGESISSVQSLLEENRKLIERLDGVDQDISELRGKVDVEIQTQMDQMLELQNELLAISKDAELKRRAESEKSSLDWLTNPFILIALTVLLSLSLLAAFALWLVKRNRSTETAEMTLTDDESLDVALEQSDEMDELADALSNELSDELAEADDDLFAEEELLDDVLSEELKESLDETIEDESENFDDLGDENLEPIIEESTESDDELLEQEDLDSLFDEDDELLAQIDETDDNESSQEAETQADDVDDLLASTPIEDDVIVDDELEEVDELIEEVTDKVTKEVIPIVEDEQDKPEISIDELLEQPEIDLPDSVIEADSDLMNDEMLQNLDKEISQQNKQLDSVADNLLSEIEQLEQMGGMLDDIDSELESESDEPQELVKQQHSIQEFDSVTDDIQDDINDELLSEEKPEDDLLASLDEGIPSLGDIDNELDGDFNDDELEEALKSFDEDIVESDFLDEEQIPDIEKASVELDDLPGLGDWLTEDGQSENKAIDELESSSFDEILDGIEEDSEAEDENIESADLSNIDDSGLDFDALLTDIDTTDAIESEKNVVETDESQFVDVEDLINESEEADQEQVEKALNLDAAFGSYEGLADKAKMVDVDGDQGIGAKLDLAQAYIETDELDSAKSLLEDIIETGDDSQQAEAKELLEKLS